MEISLVEVKRDIENYLEEYFKNKEGFNKVIYESAGYSLNIGGKRVRPILLLLTYQMYQNSYKEVLPMAAAIEMIHTYSLVHDDLPAMDNDDLRRGKPTNHKIYGEALAILAGDGLLNEAMTLMMEFSLLNGREALEAAYEISKASGINGMIAGQVVDILSETKEEICEDELRYMHLKKTGELIRCSILAGGILGKAPKDDIEKLIMFGEKLGLAFQIQDDLLDVLGDSEKLGKNINKDLERNKSNFVTIYGIEKCKMLSEKLTMECISLLDSLTNSSKYLKELTLSLLNREN